LNVPGLCADRQASKAFRSAEHDWAPHERS
jgi:hypothetical protein